MGIPCCLCSDHCQHVSDAKHHYCSKHSTPTEVGVGGVRHIHFMPSELAIQRELLAELILGINKVNKNLEEICRDLGYIRYNTSRLRD